MSTSAEVVLRDGSRARLRAVAYEDPVAQELVGRVQQEYVQRYGGPDESPVTPGEFTPPTGIFLVAEVDGVPAGTAAWRTLGDGRAEMKRVYVEPGFRRRGLAQVLVEALEADAARAGIRSLELNSGPEQPEALALYAALGYAPVPGFGVYACHPSAVFLGKDLSPAEGERSWAS
jgi:GNAT superfamily N-acetyltransferase